MNKNKKFKKVLSIFLILSVLLLSIKDNTNFSPKSSQLKSFTPKIQSIVPWTYLNYGVGTLIWDLDPHQAWDSGSLRIIGQVCEGLFSYNLTDPEMSIIPILAENMGSWSPDGKRFTVPLKQGVTFHDGSAFTADDVKWSFDRLNNLISLEKVQISNLYKPLENQFPGTPLVINETIIDNQYQITFKLNYPYMAFIPLLCFSGSNILPSDAAYPYNDLLNTTTDILIGTGPYQYIQNTDDQVILRAYGNYHQGWPRAAVEELRFIKYDDSELKNQALLNGDVQLIDYVDTNYLEQYQENPNLKVTEPYLTSTKFTMGMNNNEINQSMRQAISFAFDYDKMLNEILSDIGQIGIKLTSPVPEGILYHNPNLNYPTYDVPKARQILVDNGVVPSDVNIYDDIWWHNKAINDPIATYNYTWNEGNLFREKIGMMTAENLREIGIDVKLYAISWGEFLTKLISHPEQLQLFIIGWTPDYNDPSNMINPLMSNTSSVNFAQVNDPYLQSLMADGLSETNATARRNIYYEMQRYITEELMPDILLFKPVRIYAFSVLIEKLSFNIMDYFRAYDIVLSDSDGDGLKDIEETEIYSTDAFNPDSDEDGLSDGDEILIYGTDAFNPDSDGDGLSDGDEILIYGTDVFNPDSDEDGLSDGDEILIYGTNALSIDSDGDNLSDDDEILIYGTNALSNDSDGDNLSDDDEILIYGTNALNWDSDGDDLSDGNEILIYGTNALSNDSDSDGLSDKFEITILHTDPLEIDSDFDGLSDSFELLIGCNPLNNDTDFDGLTDGEEVNIYYTSPVLVDTDNDNLLDGFEIDFGTDPFLFDTDNDGYGDGIEVLSGSNPVDANDYPDSQNEDDTTTNDTSTDNTASDDTSTGDTASDDSQSSPFDNIPGYSQGILIGISLFAIILIYIKKKR
ncbi:ABC transporter substrate-binding protein [Candidatus Harpocratesius sp.]